MATRRKATGTSAQQARKAATSRQATPVDEKAADAPVYDERGNVRPRGTKGAKPMTFDERKRIAAKVQAEATAPDVDPLRPIPPAWDNLDHLGAVVDDKGEAETTAEQNRPRD